MSTMQAAAGVKPAIWNPNAAANWSLVLSPAFGAFLQASNWQSLGEPARASSSRLWFYFALALYAMFPIVAVATPHPAAALRMARGIGFLYLLIWYFAAARAQAKFVKTRYADDYARKPWSKALGVGVLAIFAYVVYSGVVGVAFGIVTGVMKATRR